MFHKIPQTSMEPHTAPHLQGQRSTKGPFQFPRFCGRVGFGVWGFGFEVQGSGPVIQTSGLRRLRLGQGSSTGIPVYLSHPLDGGLFKPRIPPRSLQLAASAT